MLISEQKEIAEKLQNELQNQKELTQDLQNLSILITANHLRLEREIKKLNNLEVWKS